MKTGELYDDISKILAGAKPTKGLTMASRIYETVYFSSEEDYRELKSCLLENGVTLSAVLRAIAPSLIECLRNARALGHSMPKDLVVVDKVTRRK